MTLPKGQPLMQKGTPQSMQRADCARACSSANGAWVAYIVPPIPETREDTLQLSAGDLDEAVITAIARSDASSDTNVSGSAFEKIDAFRTGVLGGLNVCREAIG